jgi:hypothetical protein
MIIGNILLIWGIFYDHFYIMCSFGTFSRFGIIHQEKSCNPVSNDHKLYQTTINFTIWQ